MLDWVRSIGRQNSIMVVIKRFANLKDGKLLKCIISCERGGKYERPPYLFEGQPLCMLTSKLMVIVDSGTIAVQVGYDEGNWAHVQMDLMEEIQNNMELYNLLYSEYNYANTFLHSLT